MKPSCVYCGKPVLTSKQRNSEGNLNPITGEKGVWLAHNACIDEFRETQTMRRLVEACSGDENQAQSVRRMILNTKGSLTLRRGA